MIAKNVTRQDLQTAAKNVDVRIENYRPVGRRHQFVLRLNSSHAWQRYSHTGRRVAAVCWHGHRDFFRALFLLAPLAVVTTCRNGKTRYDSETFEDVFPETGNGNIGSMFEPCAYRDACKCEER